MGIVRITCVTQTLIMSDLDLPLSPVKKNVAKQGRRAPGGWADAGDGLEDQKNSWAELSTKNDNDELFAETTRRPEVGRRRPAPSGWAESRRSSRSSMTQKSSSQDK